MTRLRRLRTIYRRIGITLLLAMPIGMWLAFRPWGLADSVWVSTADVTVARRGDAILFLPRQASPAGLMLLPGCPVDPDAYAPLARRLAEAAAPAIIVRVPYRCASFGNLPQQLDARINALIDAHAGTRWILAGHSRGALHAARFAMSHADRLAGLVLMGTSHPRDRDLSALSLPVLKIAATNDGVAGATPFDRRRLPASTTWVRIEGGNHAQFGYYAPYQLFDGRAGISRDAQQEQIAAALIAALDRLRAAALSRVKQIRHFVMHT